MSEQLEDLDRRLKLARAAVAGLASLRDAVAAGGQGRRPVVLAIVLEYLEHAGRSSLGQIVAGTLLPHREVAILLASEPSEIAVDRNGCFEINRAAPERPSLDSEAVRIVSMRATCFLRRSGPTSLDEIARLVGQPVETVAIILGASLNHVEIVPGVYDVVRDDDGEPLSHADKQLEQGRMPLTARRGVGKPRRART